MLNSYLVFDEHLAPIDSSTGQKVAQASVLDVGVRRAMMRVTFDKDEFDARDGNYMVTDSRAP